MSARKITILLALSVLSVSCFAVELAGKIESVQGNKITIKIESQLLPNIGDRVEVFDNIPDIGDVVLNCTWKVEVADEDNITAVTTDKSGATPQQGYKVIIHSQNPRSPQPQNADIQKEPPKPVQELDISKSQDKQKDSSAQKTGTGDALPPPADNEQPILLSHFKPYLGIEFRSHEISGLEIVSIAKDSPTQKAGLMVGDVIFEFGKQKFYGPRPSTQLFIEELYKAVRNKVGPVRIFYGRAGRNRETFIMPALKPHLGIQILPLAEQGVLVHSAEPDSAAAQADIRAGDVIVEYGSLHLRGQQRPMTAEFVYAIASTPLDTPTNIGLTRNGMYLKKTLIFSTQGRSPQLVAADRATTKPDSDTQIKPMTNIMANAPGIIIFADNFDQDNHGSANLHYRGLQNWFIQRGEVDLIGNGYVDAQPGNGLYLDLMGTPFMPGESATAAIIRTKNSYRLEPGTYRLSFSLAGNPEQGPDTVLVQIGDVFSEVFTVDHQRPNTGLKKIVRTFTTNQPRRVNLIFDQQPGPGRGALLDNIIIEKIR